MTSAWRPNPTISRWSPRNRDEMVVQRQGVRFIGTQRPSIAIENECRRGHGGESAPRSTTSTSRMSSRMPSRPRRPLGGGAGEALVIERVTSQASVSPNSMPGWPRWATGSTRGPDVVPDRFEPPATSRSSERPSSRIALGDRRRVPSAARVR